MFRPQTKNEDKESVPGYINALSPMAPSEVMNLKEGTVAGKKHHGFSEYNKRGPAGDDKKVHQDSEFNYRK